MNKLLLILFSLTSCQIYGQIFWQKKVFPGIKTIKTKQYSDSGGGGYWNIKHCDSEGRMIYEELYRTKRLMGRNSYKYDQMNNEILFVSLYDINNPNTIDTISISSFEYDSDNRIVKKLTINGMSTSTIDKIDRNGNITTYRQIVRTPWEHRDSINCDTIIYRLTYNTSNQILKQVRENVENGDIEITHFTYCKNGELKRRVITRIPDPEYSNVYVGGPGSDDMSYEYKYDKKGRVKVLYTIVEGKRYKLARYKYTEW